MTWFKELDRILRGEATRPDVIRDGTIDVPVRTIVIVVLCLAAFTGLCMGSFSLFKEIDGTVAPGSSVRLLQILATTIKVPALFTLTLFVTFPSLYVFNALVGSRLEVVSLLRLLVVALAVNLAVLASLGPIIAFFSVSTRSYSFVVLLNVAVFSASGFLGILFLIQTLNRLTISLRRRDDEAGAASTDTSADRSSSSADADDQVIDAELLDDPGAIDAIEGQPLGKHVKLVFRCWMVIFGIVGAQMGWVLRPFIGAPNQPFEWFRPRESNFFQAVWDTFVSLLLGG